MRTVQTALVCVLLMAAPGLGRAEDASEVDFNRDIRPILSDKCFFCHGPDAGHRKANMRLDQPADVFAERDGLAIIQPGSPEGSLAYRRLTSANPAERMPPPDSGRSITEKDLALIVRWIREGARWQDHWAFIPPRRAEQPAVKQQAWPRNGLDRFILSRIEQASLQPSAEADRRTWLRRVSLDLTGLPPTREEVREFLGDESAAAHEQVVDRLLASPRYGEHMARFWLDEARYGDTHGLHFDNYREMWPYRDWVIMAFNRNLSFKDFLIEQVAGDLLPEATRSQKVASGFNRAHITTNEGGSIDEEVYVRNVVDRANTFGTVFLGLTVGCAACHDHKFDPVSQKDYYRFFAFFNSLDANAMDGNKQDHEPVLRVPSIEQEQQIEACRAELAALAERIKAAVAGVTYSEPEQPTEQEATGPEEIVWIEDDLPTGAKPSEPWSFVTSPQPVYSGQRASTRTADGVSQHFFTGATEPLIVGKGDSLFAYVYLDPDSPPKAIMLQWNDGGWEHRAYWGGGDIPFGNEGTAARRRLGDLPSPGAWTRLAVGAAQVGLEPGAKINGWAFTQFGGTVYWDKAGMVTSRNQRRYYDSFAAWVRDERAATVSILDEAIRALVNMPAATTGQGQQLLDYFVEHVYAGTRETFEPLHRKQEELERKIAEIEMQFPTTLVWKETAQPRDAFVLLRGEYDQRGEKVRRGTPGFLPPFPADAPTNRLGLAQWLVQDEHPLTARVAVNRLWQQIFGVGLVKTSEDFGAQGEWPSHPELLDWLAVEFVASGWDIKHFLKQVTLSATYRQSSKIRAEQLARDPGNRLLARGPRFRLDAETLRDQALAVSGLLVEKLGGPGVKPPQPAGLWKVVGYVGSNTSEFKADTEPDKVHRRSVYTFWKRTSPPPQMTIFDAPSREACTVRRERTNTPLQALMLMNDPQYVEAARAFAEKTLREGGNSMEARLTFAFETATARLPSATELRVMTEFVADSLAAYRENVEAAKAVIAIGPVAADDALDPAELAAWTMLTSLILNMDEVLNKG